MSAKENAPPGGDHGALAKQNVVTLTATAKPGNKTSRTRYVRFFPERLMFATAVLTPPEVVAWMRLTLAFVMRDGVLPADDRALAGITQTGQRWPALRDKLLDLGLGRIEGGLWVDDDQHRNLEIQRRSSERGTKGATARWTRDA